MWDCMWGQRTEMVSYLAAMLPSLQGDPSGRLQPPVDLDLGSSGSWWAATVATNCPSAQIRWRS